MEEELWFPLGRGEWTEIEGPVRCKGTMHFHGWIICVGCPSLTCAGLQTVG
jgi:hypothetical protein